MRRLCIIFALFISSCATVQAQEVYQDLQETVRGEVEAILHEESQDIIGTDTDAWVQEISVRLEEGERRGEAVTFFNDLVPLTVGDEIFVNRMVSIQGVEYFQLKDVDRRGVLIILSVLFASVLFCVAGWHGTRALISLGGSVLMIGGVLVPLLLAGYSPVWVSVGVAVPILAILLFSTHGFHSRVVIAFLGTISAVFFTGFLAWFSVTSARLTGLSSDAAIYLNFSTSGALDFGALLFGGIIIGILGILDDVAITQASVVCELIRANPALRFFDLYARALRVGRDHIGSLVNTLALAYAGVSLPLLLLFAHAESDLMLTLNQELVAVEFIRMCVGSIGLIATVPLTTLIASLWYTRYPDTNVQNNHHHH